MDASALPPRALHALRAVLALSLVACLVVAAGRPDTTAGTVRDARPAPAATSDTLR